MEKDVMIINAQKIKDIIIIINVLINVHQINMLIMNLKNVMIIEMNAPLHLLIMKEMRQIIILYVKKAVLLINL